jgi:Arc/MetJ-type ribon-helix-helix transcriptional regulator
MKIKVSISMEASTFEKVGSKVDEGLFRNKSHFIEYAVKKCLSEDKL